MRGVSKSKCGAEFPLPLLGISDELLQVHLLLPQGSKGGLTLHEAFAANIQLDLPQGFYNKQTWIQVTYVPNQWCNFRKLTKHF